MGDEVQPRRARSRPGRLPPGARQSIAHGGGDGLVSLSGRMLIDHCGAGAGVSHPLHQLAQASAVIAYRVDWFRASPPDFGEQLREGSALVVASSRGPQTR